MAVIRDARPPAPQPLLLGDDHQTAPAWLAFFEQVGKRLSALTNDTAKAANGYAAIPGSGVVLMWGTTTTDATGVASVTFPAAFPTAAGSITATIAAGGPTICSVVCGTPSTTGVAIYTTVGGVVAAATVRWMATGW
jgi:hypothetical protein